MNSSYVPRSEDEFPPLPDLLAGGTNTSPRVTEELAWLRQLRWDFIYMASPFIGGFINKSSSYASATIIFNQAVNDFLSLLDELSTGDGRPATRTARALIEHAINIADVSRSNTQAERYQAHLGFEAEYAVEVSNGYELLSATRRRKIESQKRHRYSKVRGTLAAAISRYGRTFRRAWSADNLSARAERVGLTQLYQAYRLCSLVTHGAAGGAYGNVANIAHSQVFRTGAALQLCPLSYIVGVDAFLSVMNTAAHLRGDLDIEPAKKIINVIRSEWPEYLNLVNDLDKKLWPTTPPTPPTAILAVARNGTLRWYWHDPAAEVLIEAEPPSVLSDRVKSGIDKIRDRVIADPDSLIVENSRFLSISFAETVTVRPKSSARPVSSWAILLRPQEIDWVLRK